MKKKSQSGNRELSKGAKLKTKQQQKKSQRNEKEVQS